MFNRKSLVFVCFMVALIGVLTLPFFNCNQPVKDTYHGYLQTDSFNTLSRTAQVATCTPCHKQEAENEKLGPHSHAYQMLLEHKGFVNSSQYQCGFYTDQVNKSFNTCLTCHAPQDLFQTVLKDSANKPELFISKLVQQKPRPHLKKTADSRLTSIDCINCHYDGNKMLSLKHIPSKKDGIVSEQTPEVITANNISCFPCHFVETQSMDVALSIKLKGNVLCNSCHQQYSPDGKGTHYTYWNKDPATMVNPNLANLLQDFKFALTSDKKSGEVTWINTCLPHAIKCPEMIVQCDVLDKDSNLLGTKKIRANQKTIHDKEMYAHLGNNNLYGEAGDEPTFDGSPRKYAVAISTPEKAKFYRLTFIHKAQYWFPDSLGQTRAVQVFAIK